MKCALGDVPPVELGGRGVGCAGGMWVSEGRDVGHVWPTYRPVRASRAGAMCPNRRIVQPGHTVGAPLCASLVMHRNARAAGAGSLDSAWYTLVFLSHRALVLVHGTVPRGPLAQLAEQQTLNLRVEGSIPSRLTTFLRDLRISIRVNYFRHPN